MASATTRFSGGWMRAQGPFYTDPDALVHTADPDHADESAPDSNAWSYQAPPGTLQGGWMPENEWMGVVWPDRDRTPYDDHDVGPNTRPRYSDAYVGVTGRGSGNLSSQMEAANDAAVDYGDPMVDAYSPAPYQFDDEVYGGDRFDSFGPQPVSPEALRRGANSDPQNNPPIVGQPHGFRLGSDLVPWLDRKFRIGERFHDRHVLSPNDAQPPTDQIRPDGESAYLSPFSSATRVVTRVFNTPERMQAPPDFSESITVDTANEPAVFPENW
jgi:hypothetical protein